MDRHFLRLTKFFSVFFSLILLTLVQTVLSVDQHFQACEPKNCGSGPDISYPFWIHQVHEDYCGYPGFRINCRNDEPILQTSNNDYIIQDIFYNNQSFWLMDSGSVDKPCPAPLHNFTTNRAPFEFAQNVANLVFFYNCTTLYPVENLTYPVFCDTNRSLHSFAMLLPRGQLDYSIYASLECKHVVGAPVDFDGELIPKAVEQRNYNLFLQNGFALRWITTATSCIKCLRSGGRCGFLKEEFVCFCSDRPHSKSCKGMYITNCTDRPHSYFP
ncbi:hypothetical protein AQUCO_04100072v1 [Aquilegia coerulea]|uniref:Wall-associated receptor kinase galacturonan-binding domain-containing protein n=1 Tax=Aquilegia coerulea TaxID=218851 RepID=A0A2G5CQ15_AQUCA|nr:hypothetical protein AQUCO_04100072v1 [Aquilegia coerulea]